MSGLISWTTYCYYHQHYYNFHIDLDNSISLSNVMNQTLRELIHPLITFLNLVTMRSHSLLVAFCDATLYAYQLIKTLLQNR